MNQQSIALLNPRQYLIDTILASPIKRATEIFISVMFRPLIEVEDYQRRYIDFNDRSSFFLHCVRNYPNEFALKLSHIVNYFAEKPVVKNIFIFFLHSLFLLHKSPVYLFTPATCSELKPVLLSLLRRETKMPIFNTLSMIISVLVSHMFHTQDFNQDWVEFLDLIGFLLLTKVEKGLTLIRDLPVHMKGPLFKMNYGRTFQNIIFKHLDRTTSNEDEDEDKDKDGDVWVLVFGACYTMALLLVRSRCIDLVNRIMDRVMNSVRKLFENGKQVYVRKGFESIDYVAQRERRRYTEEQVAFVSELADYVYCVDGITKETKDVLVTFMSLYQFYL